MNRLPTGALVIGMVFAGVIVVAPPVLAQDGAQPDTAASDQEEKQPEWTGERDGSVITRADLDEILRLHKLWVETGHEHGERARLVGADLSKANLRGTNLSGANILGVRLIEADLSKADLSSAYLGSVDLNGANLREVDLGGANLIFADLAGARLRDADFTDASVAIANFDGAYFEPKPNSLPYIPSMSTARNLDKLQYMFSGAGLIEL